MKALHPPLFALLINFPIAAQSPLPKTLDALEHYLNMAGHQTARDFKPLTQQERTDLYLRSLVNPWGFAKAAASSGIDHWRTKPTEWGQGWGAYGKRYANIEGQYLVNKTATYLISSTLHEDTRYFGSGRHGAWRRVGYALVSPVLARHDNGRLYLSAAQVGGVAAGAFTARLWLPPSQSSAGDAAASFGITMATNAATSIAKEFLPDLLRRSQRYKPAPTHP
jgi:hypothetical protein